MKRIFIYLLILVICLSACRSYDNIESADLSQISIDGFGIGDCIDEIDISSYTPSDRYSTGIGTYNFEECRIETSDGVITKITANFGIIDITINGLSGFLVYEDIEALLGSGTASWYDREQSLRQIQYVDGNYGIKGSFVYDNNSDQLIWIILEKQ